MSNEKLQRILKQYPSECEILVMDDDYSSPTTVTAEYTEDDDFTLPKIIIYVQQQNVCFKEGECDWQR